jgi:hypothetical protein
MSNLAVNTIINIELSGLDAHRKANLKSVVMGWEQLMRSGECSVVEFSRALNEVSKEV